MANTSVVVNNVNPTHVYKRPVSINASAVVVDNNVEVMGFDASDAIKFPANNNVVFDGKLNLATSVASSMTGAGTTTNGRVWSVSIDLNAFNVINSMVVN